ncbi:alpha/beta hydrolase [Paraburkholderia sp. LEh10]|uniref:alpha/beta fold hydrolase n=1 Tax=Paraburkholderia sp. LEh10 TaxID=2821353 RepID=UPI001AE56940|nr:alpha/beta hydrolase [Paraburkholderia sp. LEh10]MBP0590397.1 alpha/beta hydrolase [Paraburkholderia sp. LEh10]
MTTPTDNAAPTVAYSTLGSGPEKVVALHGWMGDEYTYSKLTSVLDVDAFTYAFPVYRGYGASRHLVGEYTVEEIARDVLAVADKLNWPRFNIVGHSMGGLVAQRILLDASERVKRIVAVTPVPACGARFDSDTLELFLNGVESDEVCMSIVNFSTGGRLPRRWVEETARHARSVVREDAMRGYLRAFNETDISAGVDGNGVPIKVLVGEHDPAHTVAAMRDTFGTWYPNARIETINNAGHYPMDEAPLALVSAIESYLKERNP